MKKQVLLFAKVMGCNCVIVPTRRYNAHHWGHMHPKAYNLVNHRSMNCDNERYL